MTAGAVRQPVGCQFRFFHMMTFYRLFPDFLQTGGQVLKDRCLRAYPLGHRGGGANRAFDAFRVDQSAFLLEPHRSGEDYISDVGGVIVATMKNDLRMLVRCSCESARSRASTYAT